MRAVLFDYFGTLTPAMPAGAGARSVQERIAALLGLEVEAWTSALDGSHRQRFLGATGSITDTVAALARQAGGSPSAQAVAEAVALRTQAYLAGAVPREETPEVLRAVRARGLRVGLISNCSVELAEHWPDLGLAELFDVTVLSCSVGLAKPDPRIYRLACERLCVEPGHCLFVGDGDSDELPGAAAVGIRAVHLRTPDWAGGFRYQQVDWPGETVDSLAGVLDLLG